MLKYLAALFVSAGLALGFTPAALAQASGPVNSGGVLTASTAGQSFDNLLDLQPGTHGYSFSGSTGSYSQMISSKGFYYAAYLFTFAPTSDVQSATLTLNNASGVAGLSGRLYTWGGSFLGDASAASAGQTAVQGWTSSLPAFGVSLVNLNASALDGGTYVLELRGTNQGSFAGAISFATPVPEPITLSMLLSGLGLLGGLGMRRRLLG